MRLSRLEDLYGGQVALAVKAFPLVPTDSPGRLITPQSVLGRQRAGEEAQEEGLVFSPWPQDRPLPRSSIPALEAAKCARLQGEEAFRRYDLALYRAFFTECRDIAAREVLLALAEEVGLEMGPFRRALEQGEQRKAVFAEFLECLQRYGERARGIPLVTFNDGPPLVGAFPFEVYQAAARRFLASE